jgi:outer membrane immunogenic protein
MAIYNYKNNLFLISLFTNLFTSAYADNAFEGFYEELGLNYQSTHFNLSATPLTISALSFPSYTSISNYNGITAGLFAGYFKALGNGTYLLGAGLGIHPLNSASENYSINFPATGVFKGATVAGSYQKRSSYEIFISPALMLDNKSMAYLKLGYLTSEVRKNYTVTATSSASYEQNQNTSATLLGIGLKRFATDKLYYFSELNYDINNRLTVTNSVPVSTNTATYSASSGGYFYSASFGLGYKF